jgi:hypothetical protein
MKKLISMTDFVLENENMVKQTESEMSKDLFKLAQYAHFLKQPLKLEMFVPCDECGDFLDEPQMYERKLGFGEVDYEYDEREVQQYQQALSKVIFEGFEVIQKNQELVVVSNKKNGLQICFTKTVISCNASPLNLETLEDLVKFNLELK